MKASELIIELQAKIKAYGDIEVKIADWQEQVSAPISISANDIFYDMDIDGFEFIKIGNDDCL